jgi:hypothetical protein
MQLIAMPTTTIKTMPPRIIPIITPMDSVTASGTGIGPKLQN